MRIRITARIAEEIDSLGLAATLDMEGSPVNPFTNIERAGTYELTEAEVRWLQADALDRAAIYRDDADASYRGLSKAYAALAANCARALAKAAG